MSKTRLEREAKFHNQAFSEKTRAAAGKFYAVASISKQFYHDLIDYDCKGKNFLEYGCGVGSYAFELARLEATVTGIDISDVGIEQAKKRAIEEGLSEKLSFYVMNAESLDFSDNFFDRVCGSGILHHLDLNTALKELTRVLKNDGEAIFFEPLGHNPLINLYRRLTPHMRSEDEHPLHIKDLHLLSQYFNHAEFRYFHLFSLLAVPFRKIPGFKILLKSLAILDQFLFRFFGLKKFAWIVVIKLSK